MLFLSITMLIASDNVRCLSPSNNGGCVIEIVLLVFGTSKLIYLYTNYRTVEMNVVQKTEGMKNVFLHVS